MDGKDSESPGPRPKDKNLPGHDIFCTPENSSFLSKTPYKTLDPTRREIRLLKVLPDSGSGFVECELLPSAPIAELRRKYLALSYCAGNPRNTEVILVNGVKCNVFANLCHALTCARHFWATEPRDGDFLLWADQICINQADLSERSHQVGFMRSIYESAQQTLICLSTSNTQGQGMKWFIDTFDQDGGQALTRSRSKPTVNCKNNLIAFWEEVMESPWWTRAWVFQEFVVSAQATLLSGCHHLSWMRTQLALKRYLGPESDDSMIYCLKSLFKTRNSTTHYAGDFNKAADTVRSMLKVKAEWNDTADNLIFLLLRSRNFKASDDRDRIYAVLGLAHPGYAITPDYSASNTLCHVLVETTRKIILFENSIHVLTLLSGSRRHRWPGLPSWVVDWTSQEAPRYRSGSANCVDAISGTPGGGPAIASFRETIHPETLQTTTVMEVMGTFIAEVCEDDEQPNKRSTMRPRASNACDVFPRRNALELWYLCGLKYMFYLQRKSYGYRIIRCNNPVIPGTTFPRFSSKDFNGRRGEVKPRAIPIF